MVVQIQPLTDGRFRFARGDHAHLLHVEVPEGSGWLRVPGLGPQLMIPGEDRVRYNWSAGDVARAIKRGDARFSLVEVAHR